MATIESAVAYLVKEYPYKDDLSNARVTKMLYLADWYNALNRKPLVTRIRWYYDNYGPFVWDVRRAVLSSHRLNIKPTSTVFGDPKEIFELSDEGYEPTLTSEEKAALDHVIEQTKSLGWSSFIKLVYSTYPISSSAKYSYLNLEGLAASYRNAGQMPS